MLKTIVSALSLMAIAATLMAFTAVPSSAGQIGYSAVGQPTGYYHHYHHWHHHHHHVGVVVHL